MNHKIMMGFILAGLWMLCPMLGWADPAIPPTLETGLLNLLPPAVYAPPIRLHGEQSVAVPPDKYEPRRTRHKPVFVIHETAMSGRLTLAEVTDPKYRASFHALILRDGSVYFMVPADKTAYTAGISQFKGEYDFSDSGRRTVNHFAYQVELESPEEGYWCHEYPNYQPRISPCLDNGGQGKTHAGYTPHQYAALAELALRTGVSKDRITTHAAVDLSGTRSDPRSFDWPLFWNLYETIEQRDKTIVLGNE